MAKRGITGASILVIFAAAGVTASATNILSNGDFETGVLTPWTAFTTGNGTNGAGLPDVVPFNTTGYGASLAAQFDVGEVNFTGLQEGGGITQMFNVASAGQYAFYANIGALDDADGMINGDGGTFSILIDNITRASFDIGPFSSADQILTATLSGLVSLNAGNHTFAVLITRPYLSSGVDTPTEYLDNISLAGAPEPGTFALAGLALLGVALYRSRRAWSKSL